MKILIKLLLLLAICCSCVPIESSQESSGLSNSSNNKAKTNSRSVEEVLNSFYSLYDPLLEPYRNPIRISTNKEFIFHSLKNPRSIKALTIIGNKEKIDLSNIHFFKNLEYLKLVEIAPIPDNVYKLEKLKVLEYNGGVYSSQVKISDEIANLKNLEYLDLSVSNCVLPSKISELKKLKTLKFINSNYQQPYSEIFEIQSLESLQLNFVDIEQLRGIGNLKNLEIFISNKVSSEIASLDLIGMKIETDKNIDFPNEFSKLKKLKAFVWNANSWERITPPLFISSLPALEHLKLRGKINSGTIPDDYDQLKKLEQFTIITDSDLSKDLDRLKNIKDKIKIK